MSRMIATLEAEIGFELFDRTNQRLTPTVKGQEFYEEAEKVLAVVDEFPAIVEAIQEPSQRVLKVVSLPRVSAGLVVPAIEMFKQRHPAILVSFELAGRQAIEQKITHQHYDLVIGTQPMQPKMFNVTTFGESQVLLAIPTGHPLTGAREAGPEDLKDLDVVALRRRTVLRRQFDDAMEGANVRYRLAAEGSSQLEACWLAASGIGVTLADRVGAAAVPQGALSFIPWRPRTMIDYVAFTPRNRRPDALAGSFIECVKQVFDNSFSPQEN